MSLAQNLSVIKIYARYILLFLYLKPLQKLRKIIFISPEYLFLPSRYLGSRDVCINENLSLTTF